MKTLEFYIAKAQVNSGAATDTKLAALLDVSASYVCMMRTGKSIPSDDMMVKIANIAGVDKEEALLDLNVWRSSGSVKDAYANILRKLGHVAVALALCLFFSAHQDATASDLNMSNSEHDAIYYGN